jgi:hypothetical protein
MTTSMISHLMDVLRDDALCFSVTPDNCRHLLDLVIEGISIDAIRRVLDQSELDQVVADILFLDDQWRFHVSSADCPDGVVFVLTRPQTVGLLVLAEYYGFDLTPSHEIF